MYDLHIHTTASDGVFSPKEVINMAVETGLQGIAITDHDTVGGIAAAVKYVNELQEPFEFVPGIEINTDYKSNDVHILGYFIDYKNKSFLNELTKLRELRYARALEIIDKLANMGLLIDLMTVQNYAAGGLIARPHIAQALIAKGYVLTIKEAFDKYLSRGKPAYVPRAKFLPIEAIELIKMVGGIAVLAHPGLIEDKNIIQEVVQMGIEGIEVYYPEHSVGEIDNYLQICREENLLITGGSDFHGTGNVESRNRLGYAGINESHFTKLLDYSVKRNKG